MLSDATASSAGFVPYGGQHAAAVGAALVLVAAFVAAGRGLRDTAAEAHLRRAFVAFALAHCVFYNLWWSWRGLDLQQGLPLHPCDFVQVLGPLALLIGTRWMRAVLYFAAFALTTQAFIQPALSLGHASMVFWSFWIAHSIILACAAYDLAVLGFRPGWGDLARACAAGAVYVVLIMPLNLVLGSNYGFIGDPAPPQTMPPLVEALGAWPGRVAAMLALAALGFAILLLPWLWIARLRAGTAGRAGAAAR